MRQPLFALVLLLLACHYGFAVTASSSGEEEQTLEHGDEKNQPSRGEDDKVFRRRRRTIKGGSSPRNNAKARGTKKKGWIAKNLKRNRNKANNAENAMPSTTTATDATTNPARASPARCNPECPCCDSAKWPEFVKVIESGDPACYSQNDPKRSSLAAAIHCDPYYQVAYMSYSYSGMFKGGRFCGDSGTARQFLDATEAVACTAVLDAAMSIGATPCSATFGECT